MSKTKETIEKDLTFKTKSTAEIAQMSQAEQKQYWTQYKAFFMAKKAKIQSEIRKRRTEAEKATRRDLKKKRVHYFCVLGGIIEEKLNARGKTLDYEVDAEKMNKFAEFVERQEKNGDYMSKALCAKETTTSATMPKDDEEEEHKK